MQGEFEMSMIGELNFFLVLQIKQTKEGIFVNQAKYTRELINKFGLKDVKTFETPMSTNTRLDKDEQGCKMDRKSTSGSCQFLGNTLVSWFSKKQHFVAISTMEAEYIVAGSCVTQIISMK